jgi:putative ABC transport system permease protein
MRSAAPLPVRLYGAAASLLPPDMQRNRDEMVRTFAALWREPRRRGAGILFCVHSLYALLIVLAAEWLEYLGARRAPGRTRQDAPRGGMGFWKSLRYALRTLRKTPTFALTSILLVAVGVGSVTTIFTLVDHVLLRPLPYPDAERLVTLSRGAFQGPYYRELQTMHTVVHWEASQEGPVNLVGVGDPLRLRQARVSRGFFDLFGAHAQRGRLLDADDYRTADAVVLGAGAWHRIWGSDPSVVGQTIELNGAPVTVVGIVQDGFSPPEALVGDQVDIWRPLDWSSRALSDNTSYTLNVAARLAPGVTLEAAQAEADAVSARMASVHRNYRNRDGTPELHAVQPLADATVRGVGALLRLLLGAVGLLLLVACANVGHLFLARGLGRTREMAVRRAMGASTLGLTTQLLGESLVVAMLGGLAGAALAWVGIRAFVAMNPQALPRQASVAMDPRVLGFAIALSVLTSLVFGLVPALRAVRGDPADELRGAGRTATSGRGASWLRSGLVVAEMALSLVLTAGAGLLLRSFLAVRAVDPGFSVAGVWTVPLNLRDPGTPERYREIMDGILEEVRKVPGVKSAAYALTAPLQWAGGTRCCMMDAIQIPGRKPDRSLNPYIHPVTETYFTTLGERIVAGQVWSRTEAVADPVPVIVNETLARSLAGSAGKAVGVTFDVDGVGMVITGVSRDDRHFGLDQVTGPALYMPMERVPFAPGMANVMVKIDPAVASSAPRMLREAVWAAQPGVPVPVVRSLRSSLDRSTAGRRFESVLSGVFATMALLLAAGGLYGTLLYVTGQRRREMGIRLALGASNARVQASMLRSGLTLGLVGITLGLAGAWSSNRFLQSRIWGVGSEDPWALGGAAALLFLTAVLASWLPARRAGRVDPLRTLRVE